MLKMMLICSLGLMAGVSAGGPEVSSTDQSESFTFVAFGDRTGGPSEGVEVLESAVEMTNWLDPDLVMTVGDLVEGYGGVKTWLEQFEEFRTIMDELSMPWFPVAGNHDVYSRPKRAGGHKDLYREHFGPLIYSFDHKFAHFVVLFSDEALDFHDPSTNQNMSQSQLDWLKDDLAKTDAKQVFVFLHHPRWTKTYEGCNWDDVHSIFVGDGRSTTIVGGHFHTLRDDGMRDNVHYLTLATTGGWPSRQFDHASLHHITQFQVRGDRVSIVHIPMDSILPGDAFPGIEYDEIKELQKGDWVSGLGQYQVGEFTLNVQLENTTNRDMKVKVGLHLPEGMKAETANQELTISSDQVESLSFVIKVEPGFDSGVHMRSVEIIARAYYEHANGKSQPVSITKQSAIFSNSG